MSEIIGRGHPPHCPVFLTKEHESLRDTVLADRAKNILAEFRKQPELALRSLSNSKPLHANLFHGCAPKGFEYYAGNYRGDDFVCLKHYQNAIKQVFSDGSERYAPGVGFEPFVVSIALTFGFKPFLKELFEAQKRFYNAVTDEQLVSRYMGLIKSACATFNYFLRVHPYYDGNGRTARLLLAAMFLPCGLRPSKHYSVSTRPQPRNYTLGQAFGFYRDGDPRHLYQYLIDLFPLPEA